VSPADRAKAAHAAAEAAREAGDITTARALSAAASAWERVAGPGVAWSTKKLEADLLRLRIDVVAYRGPFQPPQPPKAPSPAHAVLSPSNVAGWKACPPAVKPEAATIEF